jgi:hypothetical protein
MTAVDEVRPWSLERWIGHMDELAEQGVVWTVYSHKGHWKVTSQKGSGFRAGEGRTLHEALTDMAVRFLEGQKQ